MTERFAKFVIKYRFPLLILIVVVSLPLIYLTRTTRLSHRAGQIFPWGHPNVNLHLKMSEVFGRSNLVAITLRTKEGDIFNPHTLGKVYRIQRAVELMDGVVKYNIYSIASRGLKYVETATDTDGVMMLIVETFDDMLEQILKGDQEMLETYRKNILNDDEIYGALVSRDRKGAAILATFNYEEDYLYIFQHLNEVIEKEKDSNTKFHLSGRPIMLAYIHKYMSKILYIFFLALVIMVMLLYVDFGRKRAIFLPLTAGLLSVVWGMGILNLLGFEMDVLSTTVPFLVLALSHGHSVQVMQRYYEEGRKCLDKKKASEQVIATLMLPASTSILTDSIGFLSLILLPFPIIQSMAIVAATGILSIWVTSFILIPIVLSYLSLPSIRELEREGKSVVLLKILRFSGMATSGGRSRTFILIGAFILFLFGIFFTSKLQVGDLKPGSPNFWQDSEYNQADRILNEHFVGTNLLWIYLAGEEQKDLLKPEVISYKLKPGDVEVRHLLLYDFPPEERGRGLLMWDIKDDPNSHREQDRWIYYTSLRRVRRVMGAEGEDNILEADLTYDDDIMRDTWEHSHKIIGVDTLYQGNGREKFMGEDGPYTKDGGVECYVVFSKPGAPWADRKDYYLSQWVTWYDRHTFAVVRIEQWDRKGNLFKIHQKCYDNWDKMSKQPRDNRDQLIRMEWYIWDLDIDHETWARINPPSRFNVDCPDDVFTVRYMKNQRFWRDDLDNVPRLKHPEEMPPKPPLWPEKFPEYRKVVIPADLKAKIENEKRHRWLWK